MIQVTNERNGQLLCKPTRTVKEALQQLIVSELGFGGRITQMEEDKICVDTYILNCRDVTTFEGSQEDMSLLFEAGVTSIQISQCKNPALFDQQVDKVMEITKGNPLLIKLASPMIFGASNIKLLLVNMLLQEENDDIAKKLLSAKNDDLFEAVWMVRRENMTLTDVLLVL